MKLKLMFGALVGVLVACGSDGSGDGGGGAAQACVVLDEEGRPGVCTAYTGEMYEAVSPMEMFCPQEQIIRMERVRGCPTGGGLVGHCKHSPGKEEEMEIYYYLYSDDDTGAAAENFQHACESSEGIWSS